MLAVMTAWALHVSTSLIGAHSSALGTSEHSHAHGGHFSDQGDTTLVDDHQHETPYVGVQPVIKQGVARAPALQEPVYPLPTPPIYPIKRPPRPQSVS